MCAMCDELDKMKLKITRMKRKNLSVSCHYSKGNKIHLELDNSSSINQFDMPIYDKLSQDFDELQKDVTSLNLKNKALKLTASSSSKEIKILENKNKQSKLVEEILKSENEKFHALINDLNPTILKFYKWTKSIIFVFC